MSEKPVRDRPRRLADWLNPTGDKKVHSLVDKVYLPDSFFESASPTRLCESWMRETRTSSLSGGRRPALRCASSDPTPLNRGN